MLIVCPNCTSSYEVQPDKLGDAGRSVRCARCATTWFAAAGAGWSVPSRTLMPSAETTPNSGQQIEGGEFGWTFNPDDDIADATQASPRHDAAGASDDGAPTQSGEFQTEPDVLPGEIEPVVISDAPSLAPMIDGDVVTPAEGEAHEAAENIETLAARRARRAGKRKRTSRRPGLPVVIAAMVAILGGLLIGRKQVVQFLPQTASLYEAIGLPVNLRGLVFDGVKTMRETSDGVTVLVVEGSIANVTPRTVEVPRLRFGVRNAAGLEIYAWTAIPSRTILPPGDAVEFRSRLASPPADARDVVVRFFNRRDIVSGR